MMVFSKGVQCYYYDYNSNVFFVSCCLTCVLINDCNVHQILCQAIPCNINSLCHMTTWFSVKIGMHDDVIKWKHFPRYWPFVQGIHRSAVNSPHKGQWRGALMFLSSAPWINGSVHDREAGDLRRNRSHYDVIVMYLSLRSVKPYNINLLFITRKKFISIFVCILVAVFLIP